MKKISPINILGISGFILTLVYLFYFLKKVDISLIYYWQQSVPLSVGESLKVPGGISDLLADRILEIISLPTWGSLAMAFLVVIVFISLKVIFRNVRNNPLFYALLIAALIPFIILFAYLRLPFELVISLTAGLVLAMLHSLYEPRNILVKFLFNFCFGIVVFMIAGVPGLLVLFQVIIVQYIFSKSYVELISALPLLIIPLLYLPFNLSLTLRQAYMGSLLISEYDEVPLAFYLSLSSPLLLLLVFSVIDYIFSKFTPKRPVLILSSSLIVLLGVLYMSTQDSYNERVVNSHRILEASFNKDWEEVIELTKETGTVNKLVLTKVNRALYEKGELLDKLFTYPQQFGEEGIFLDRIASSRVAIHTADFYYALGFAMETRHWATEAQMSLVRHPIVLKYLVMSYIAIGQEETALKYLRVLSGSRINKNWCNDIYAMLETGSTEKNPDIKFFRINDPDRDFFAGTKDPVAKLAKFYSSNGDNRMAFEFLVAGHLMKHNIGAVIVHLSDFEKHGFDQFPRAVEEALMIYVARTKDPSHILRNYSISSGTVERFKDFNSLVSNVESKAERMKVLSKYKDTYWFYILFSSPYASKK